MFLTIDTVSKTAYLTTDIEKARISETILVDEDILADVDINGEIIGLEFLMPPNQIYVKYENEFIYPADLIEKLKSKVKDELKNNKS